MHSTCKINGEQYAIFVTRGELDYFMDYHEKLTKQTEIEVIRKLDLGKGMPNIEPVCLEGIHKVAIVEVQFNNCRPELAHMKSFQTLRDNVTKEWKKLEHSYTRHVVVNKVGGYSIVDSDIFTWGDSVTYSPDELLTVSENSNTLNIENDPKADPWVTEFVMDDYNIINNLNYLSYDQTKYLMVKCVENGVDTLFVYTTGMYEKQARQYTKAAIDAGITKFIWVKSISGYRSIFHEICDMVKEAGLEASLYTYEDFEEPFRISELKKPSKENKCD